MNQLLKFFISFFIFTNLVLADELKVFEFSQEEFERLVDRIMELLENSSYPERRLNRSKTTLRRLVSRGNPNIGEYENLMGIFKAIKEGKR